MPLGISGTFIVSRHRLWDERFNCLRLRLYPCRQSRVLDLHDEGVWRLQAIRYVISSAVLGFGGIFRRTNPESRRALDGSSPVAHITNSCSRGMSAHKVVVAAHVSRCRLPAYASHRDGRLHTRRVLSVVVFHLCGPTKQAEVYGVGLMAPGTCIRRYNPGKATRRTVQLEHQSNRIL